MKRSFDVNHRETSQCSLTWPLWHYTHNRPSSNSARPSSPQYLSPCPPWQFALTTKLARRILPTLLKNSRRLLLVLVMKSNPKPRLWPSVPPPLPLPIPIPCSDLLTWIPPKRLLPPTPALLSTPLVIHLAPAEILSSSSGTLFCSPQRLATRT